MKPAVLAARQRGVMFDIGHGKGSFSWKTARAMLAEGFAPDTISSDVHALCINGPAYDQVTTLSKFLALGMRLRDVIAASTVNAAAALKRPDLGTLKPGSVGDASVLSLERASFVWRTWSARSSRPASACTPRRRDRRPLVASLTRRTWRSMDTLQNFIDGRWTDAPERAPAMNPATGQQIAWLP